MTMCCTKPEKMKWEVAKRIVVEKDTFAFIFVRYARVTTRFNRSATNRHSICMHALKTHRDSISWVHVYSTDSVTLRVYSIFSFFFFSMFLLPFLRVFHLTPINDPGRDRNAISRAKCFLASVTVDQVSSRFDSTRFDSIWFASTNCATRSNFFS